MRWRLTEIAGDAARCRTDSRATELQRSGLKKLEPSVTTLGGRSTALEDYIGHL